MLSIHPLSKGNGHKKPQSALSLERHRAKPLSAAAGTPPTIRHPDAISRKTCSGSSILTDTFFSINYL